MRRASFSGTNNLGRGHTSEEAASGVAAIVREVLSRSKGRLLLNALLPRGDGDKFTKSISAAIVGTEPDGSPLRSLMPAVLRVNAALNASSRGGGALSSAFPGRLAYVDCGGPFLTAGWAPGRGPEVRLELMPDRLHPNAEGHRLWAGCIESSLRRAGWLR